MPSYHIDLIYPNNLNSRESIRKFIILEFLKELAGNGKEENASKYTYTVERCSTGRTIQIQRPAYLNKGMDFTVHVSGVSFRPKGAFKDRPKHQEIIDDLNSKQQDNPIEYKKVKSILQKIYHCQNYDTDLLKSINIQAGLLSCEEVCLTVKWLFIEQDVTYWNYSGRSMLFDALSDHDLI